MIAVIHDSEQYFVAKIIPIGTIKALEYDHDDNFDYEFNDSDFCNVDDVISDEDDDD